jgi:murein DD-endopeptidase MepM/ murein hydrolase activator NlpD
METRNPNRILTLSARGLALIALVTGLAHVASTPAKAAPRGDKLASAWPAATQRPTPAPAHDDLSGLDLGSRRLASHLLTRRPSRALRAAAHGGGGQKLLWPLSHGNFVRGFGFVRKVRKDLPHLGVDIAAEPGTPIHAAADGIVAYADDGVKGYGNLAILVHADGAVTSYAHCQKLLVKPGDHVERGDTIAAVGSTGISKGPHLHFELRTGGKPRNPMPRFDRSLPRPAEPQLMLSSL